MTDERMRILEMISEGKITPEEGNDLLATLDHGVDVKPRRKARFLKIRVIEDGKEKVNVNLPISLAKIALKFLPQEAREEIESKGIEIDEVLGSISEGMGPERLITVDDEDTQVEIYVE